ncbi:hypothetical protein [Candidatus Stoquefichus massiliensis]|uniref:hypothetical protein n=1 Tax=Candidatus Stoquefichus massiliensis TaxID=1470350 RepID=UPI0004824715|nr:hypothetical protein [Candidatus Stoquefichus massiliensis]
MKKKSIIFIVVAVIGAILLYFELNSNQLGKDTYNEDHIETIENQWNLQLPDSKTLVYQRSTPFGFHGDQTKYFLFNLYHSDQSYFVDYIKEPSTEFENEVSQLLLNLQYEEQYIPKFDEGYAYQKLSQNNFHQLYLIVSDDLSKLYVIENKI